MRNFENVLKLLLEILVEEPLRLKRMEEAFKKCYQNL